MEHKKGKKILLLAIFAIAMAYLEASVVIYLRALYYPEGFAFPIRQMPMNMAVIELMREAATVVMLLAIAFLVERSGRGRLICFMLIFGIWDIFYYIWLKAAIGWPSSVLTWDLLFLIPVIWTGPVIAPIIVSILMITAAALYYMHQEASERVSIKTGDWILIVLAACVIFLAFAYNHRITFRGDIPQRFPWEIFASGVALGILMLVRLGRRLTSVN